MYGILTSARASILDLSLHVTVVSLSTFELRVMKYFSGWNGDDNTLTKS